MVASIVKCESTMHHCNYSHITGTNKISNLFYYDVKYKSLA